MKSTSKTLNIKLGEVIELANGKGITKKELSDKQPFPVYGANGIIGYAGKHFVDFRTITIGRVGSCGAINLVEPLAWISDNAMYVSKIHNDNKLEYIFYLMQSLGFADKKKLGVMPSISQKEILGTDVDIHPVSEQQIIIDSINDCISRVDEIRSLRSEALKEAQVLLGAVIEDIFREAGGEEVSLADVLTIEGKLVDPREAAYKNMLHVGGANIVSETGELIEMMTAEEEKLISGKFVFNDKDVLYSKIRPYLKKVARPDFTGLCSADMYPLRPAEGRLHRDYLFFLLLSRDFTNYAIKVSNRAGMPKVNREQLFAYRFNLPSYQKQTDVIEKLNESMQAVLAMVAEMKEAVSESDFIQQSILKKAFAGEL